MQCNVGKADKWIRIILGILVVILGLVYQSWWGLLGFVLVGTGVFGFCLLYVPLGISTCKKEDASER